MARYITVPIETNPSTLLQRIYSYLQARMPAWQPNTANLDVWIAEAMASEAADTADTASRVPDTIYRDLGRTLYNLPPIDATPAIGSTTWVVRDNAGYTIPSGTQVQILDANNVAHTFQTVGDVIILAGTNTTAAGAVTISAQEPGAASNALGGAGTVIGLVDILDFVTTVTLTGATSGGADAESDGEYLNRLVTQTSLLTRTPILPQDFADVTVYNVAGVYRAIALDGYNPAHNLLSANDSSFETGVAGYAATNAVLAQSATFAADGINSMRLTASSAADMSAKLIAGDRIAVNPGDQITGLASFRAAVTARNCQVQLEWFDVGGASLGVVGTNIAETNAAFTQGSVTATAPASTAKVGINVTVNAPANAEVHYVDKVSIRRGNTTDWVIGGTPETGNARMVTLFSLDQNGTPVAGPIKTNVDTFLQALREVNFVVNESDATVNQVNVDVQVVVSAGFDKPTVQTAVAAAITSFLNPATWGQFAVGSDASQDPHAWVNTSTIYKYELAAAINGVEGVDHIVPGSLKTSLNPAATAEQDLVLGGVVPIPNAHTITVTYV